VLRVQRYTSKVVSTLRVAEVSSHAGQVQQTLRHKHSERMCDDSYSSISCNHRVAMYFSPRMTSSAACRAAASSLPSARRDLPQQNSLEPAVASLCAAIRICAHSIAPEHDCGSLPWSNACSCVQVVTVSRM